MRTPSPASGFYEARSWAGRVLTNECFTGMKIDVPAKGRGRSHPRRVTRVALPASRYPRRVARSRQEVRSVRR